MTKLNSKATHRIALRLFHYIPLIVFILGIWSIVRLDLVRLDSSLKESFELFYDAFAGDTFWVILAPLFIHAAVFLFYDWKRNRKLNRAFHEWIQSEHNILNTDDPQHATRSINMPGLRDQRWRRLLMTQLLRTLGLSLIVCLILVLVVLALRWAAAGDSITRAHFFAVLIVFGMAIFGGLIALAVWFFNKRSHWRLLLGGVSASLIKSKSTFLGESLRNDGFLHWLDSYWADDWCAGFAWQGIGVAMVIDQFSIYVYADQRSNRRMHILVASYFPNSCENPEELEKQINYLKEDGYIIETTPAGLLVSTSNKATSYLLFDAERYGEEAGETMMTRIKEVLKILNLMGGEPVPAHQ